MRPLRAGAVVPLLGILALATAVTPTGAARASAAQPAAESITVAVPAAPWGERRAKAEQPDLDSALVDLVDAHRFARQTKRALAGAAVLGDGLAALIDTEQLRIDAQDRVQVYVHANGSVAEAAASVRHLDGIVEYEVPARGLVQARVPIDRLEELVALDTVERIRVPPYAHRNFGSELTAGDAILRADEVRSMYGVDGSGVRVGVISDGVAGLSTAQGSGDLGSVNITTCNVVAGSNPQTPGRAEGVAMLEIVRDLAPAASLYFGNFDFSTDVAFANAITCLAQNTDVAVDDIAFFNAGPYDGTSDLSMNTTAQNASNSNRIRLYSTSAGNQAEDHYEENYVDSNIDLFFTGPGGVVVATYDLHRHQATATTTNEGFAADCPGSSTSICGNTVFLQTGQTARVFMQWNDAWGASGNDYNLYLFNANGNLVDMSENVQNGNDDPVESVSATNFGAPGAYQFMIGKVPGEQNKRLEVFVLGGNLNFITRSGSIPNQADSAGNVITTAAIDAADPGNNTAELFSSRGPTNDGRNKPDIAAIDGVDVTGAGGFPTPFFGTSAAAPHVAGIGALLLELAPDLKHGEPGDSPSGDRMTLRNAIFDTAIDLGTAGTDTTYGAGRIDALGAAMELAPAGGGCTPSATTLCIDNTASDRRFEVTMTYRTSGGSTTSANAVPLTPVGITKGGAFYFTNATNPEVLLKVLNGCALNSRFWVFFAATTNVEYTITVTDTQSGATKNYFNPLGTPAPPIQDTNAFATCP